MQGNILVTEFNNHVVRRIAKDGEVSTLAGIGEAGYADGPASNARFDHPGGIAIDGNNNLFITDYGGGRIREITAAGLVVTLAGTNQSGWRDGFGTDARFGAPDGICVDRVGNLFVADSQNHTIRKVTPQGYATTVAGNPSGGFVDGSGREARFLNPSGIALTPEGDLVIADAGNHAVRRIRLSRRAPETNAAPTLAIALHPALTVRGVAGQKYQIQLATASAPTVWTPYTNILLRANEEIWYDPKPARASASFYRAITLP